MTAYANHIKIVYLVLRPIVTDMNSYFCCHRRNLTVGRARRGHKNGRLTRRRAGSLSRYSASCERETAECESWTVDRRSGRCQIREGRPNFIVFN